jgi:hypothetical protein
MNSKSLKSFIKASESLRRAWNDLEEVKKQFNG